jgi:hypothetical protein
MASFSSQPEAAPEKTSVLRTLTRFGSIGIVVAALYVGWTFYSRHVSDERAAQAIADKQDAARQQQAHLIFGSGEVKIVSYSIDKPALARGESANLCYGVINATKVTLDPPVEAAKPSAYHCLTVAPHVTTTYTITASNDHGPEKSLALTLRVR